MKDTETINSFDSSLADVSKLVDKVLYKLHPEIESGCVSVDVDTTELLAPIDCGTIEAAINNLIRHAINIMPRGGELSVTLIDGNYQWELEVADSSKSISASNSFSPLASELGQLPRLMPQVIDQYLVDAHRLALRHGGQIQTWECPQGGMANVLVVPKRKMKSVNSIRPAA
jgi:K+-sensing histidine kinase KdpD